MKRFALGVLAAPVVWICGVVAIKVAIEIAYELGRDS